jgi:hypothetical protein
VTSRRTADAVTSKIDIRVCRTPRRARGSGTTRCSRRSTTRFGPVTTPDTSSERVNRCSAAGISDDATAGMLSHVIMAPRQSYDQQRSCLPFYQCNQPLRDFGAAVRVEGLGVFRTGLGVELSGHRSHMRRLSGTGVSCPVGLMPGITASVRVATPVTRSWPNDANR